MELGLSDKVVLITGASRGIGAAIAHAFAAEGARLSLVNRVDEEGPALARELNAPLIQGELTLKSVCEQAVSKTIDHYGQLDIVINNAGVNDHIGLEQSPDVFMESLRANLFHVFAITHFALPHLKKSKGAIVNIGSKVSVTGQGNTSGYAAAKGGINALTREWAASHAADGIRVNAVLPAEVMTPMYANWLESLGDEADEMKRTIEARIPLGHRMTTAEEIAAMVVFLASDRSGHTTGQLMFPDGGYTHLDRGLS